MFRRKETKTEAPKDDLEDRGSGPLQEYLNTPGFMAFAGKLETFGRLDTSGENTADNEKVREIFEVFQEYPKVLKGLQEMWQAKAAERKIVLSQESLNKVEQGLIEQINRGNLDVVAQYARQLEEYKKAPEKIKQAQGKIDALIEKYGSKEKL